MMRPSELFLHQPIAAYRLLRFLPTFEGLSNTQDSILQTLINPNELGSFPSHDLKHDVIYALNAAEMGKPLPSSLVSDLETRVAASDSSVLTPLAARAHVLSCSNRAYLARKRLSDQMLPFVLPGDLHPIQVEAIASGDQVFGALHVDWMRKIAALTLEALAIDCNSLGFWFGPLIDVLPEKAFEKALIKLLRRRRMAPGGWGLAAIYAARLNLKTDRWLSKGGEMDHALYRLGCQGYAL